MITNAKLKKLNDVKFEYDFIESEELEPVRKPIAKIGKTASIFTLYDLHKYIAQCKKDRDDIQKILDNVEKMRTEQLARLEEYDTLFGIDCLSIFTNDEFTYLSDVLTPENFAKLIEAYDIVRYQKGFKDQIVKHEERVVYYNTEIERYQEEIDIINWILNIGKDQFQYEAQKIADAQWKK